MTDKDIIAGIESGRTGIRQHIQPILGGVLDSIPPACKSILKRFYWDKMSMKDIATLTGLKNEDTAKSTKKRCMDKFRSIAKALLEDDEKAEAAIRRTIERAALRDQLEECRQLASGTLARAAHTEGTTTLTDESPVFSNAYGSHCSSVGRFEVTRDRGTRNKTGLRLKGLDLSNKSAYGRGIMIHGSRWVDGNRWRKFIPLNEMYCQGCVTVSTRDMAYINRLVGKEEGNLLLWSYCDTATSISSVIGR